MGFRDICHDASQTSTASSTEPLTTRFAWLPVDITTKTAVLGGLTGMMNSTARVAGTQAKAHRACRATYTGRGVTADDNVVTANESNSSRLFGQKINEMLAGQHPPGDSRQVAIALAPPRNRAIAGEMARQLILSYGSPAVESTDVVYDARC